MQVTFGLSLDASQGPSPQSRFNAPVVGPLGFLSLLETYLGLSAPEVSAARRITAYLGLVQSQDNGLRFYSQSMKADSIGTAARLLSWRDEWRLGGWLGTANASHPTRLVELAAIEASARTMLPPGEAERLRLILHALETAGPGPITAVTLVDPLEDFPLLWRQVLVRMPSVKVCLPTPQGSGELRALQDLALKTMSGERRPGKAPSIKSGGIQVVRALSATTAENWLSGHQADSPADRVVLAERIGDSLDTTLAATGGVRCGFENSSPLRPALQAIGLAVEMCWAPLDVNRLIDFLTAPVGPFSRQVRNRLASAVGQQPGIGGPAWEDAKLKIAADENGEALLADIAFWLEGERWPRDEGIPAAELLMRVNRLTESIRRRLSTGTAHVATLASAYHQCIAVRDSVDQLALHGVSRVLPRQIEQLIAYATPGGASAPDAIAQVGCMRSASTPAACIEPADEVVWWMPATPSLPQQLPWSSAEVQALNDLGVVLRDPARQLTSLAMQWLRPLLAARKRFVMVLPPPGAELHPVRQLLGQIVPDFELDALDLDAALGTPVLETLAEPVASIRLPEVTHEIRLPVPVKLPPYPQSYTSLNELFNAPALFALKRAGRLKPASVLSAQEDNRFLGVLAHRVFERLFAHADALAWTNRKAVEWFDAWVGELLRTEGAVLQIQGAGMSQQHFRLACKDAIGYLLDHLRSAGATHVRTEAVFAGDLGGVPLTGTIDLLVELPDQRTVALDLKWRGDARFAKLLTQGGHLQLALYSRLVEQQARKAPVALGYFILESGALFLTHPDIFPRAQVRKPPDGVSAASLLAQAKATLDWRSSQLATGLVEVVPPGVKGECNGPEGTLPVKGPAPWDREYLVLLGEWE